MRASAAMPVLLYIHLLPGSNASGCCETTSTTSFKVLCKAPCSSPNLQAGSSEVRMCASSSHEA